ncbi:hypothetical protein OVA29_21550 [Exiguobacterium sp. SL14]|nr:hypothetical protein [Exiguobacterium sp. SL14]
MNRQKFTDKFMAAFFTPRHHQNTGILAAFPSELECGGNFGDFCHCCVHHFCGTHAVGKKGEKESNSSGKGRNGGGNFYLKYPFSIRSGINTKNWLKNTSAKKIIKAVKVYMNLMKDYYRGAKTLEDGGLYNEAAVIYLKKLKNKSEAANCYEKAKQYKKAIDLYKELEQKEKVGDLYRKMNDAKNANIYYQMVVDDCVNNSQMVKKGSLIYRKKMELPDEAQKILLKGWEEDRDAFNCLNNYFTIFLM